MANFMRDVARKIHSEQLEKENIELKKLVEDYKQLNKMKQELIENLEKENKKLKDIIYSVGLKMVDIINLESELGGL